MARQHSLIANPAGGVLVGRMHLAQCRPSDRRCPHPRAAGTAVALADGRLLVAGGWDDGWCNAGSRSCFLFDPRDNTARETALLLVPRKEPALRLRADGLIEVTSCEGKPELWSPEGSHYR